MKNDRPGPKSGPKRGSKPDSSARTKPGSKREPRSEAEPGARKDFKSDSKFGAKKETGGAFSPKLGTKKDSDGAYGSKLGAKKETGGSFSPKLGTQKDAGGAFSPKTDAKRPALKSTAGRSSKPDGKPERGPTQAFPPKRYINVYFSLGSNMGDRQANLRAAALLIDKNIGKIARKSHVYETEPWGQPDQDSFLNQVIMANTTMDPRDLLEIITVIEKELGRVKKEKWGPRTIDIDILFYGKRIIRDKGLDIPHPELHNRAFVLVPLLEIAPELEHPVFKQPIDELYMACKDLGEVVQLD